MGSFSPASSWPATFDVAADLADFSAGARSAESAAYKGAKAPKVNKAVELNNILLEQFSMESMAAGFSEWVVWVVEICESERVRSRRLAKLTRGTKLR